MFCSLVKQNPSKEKDPGSFTIPCEIGCLHIDNALADLGASINLMSYTMYEKLVLGEPKPKRMSMELADRVGSEEVIFDVDQSMKKPYTEDDKFYRNHDLDKVIQFATLELLDDDQPYNSLEEDIDQPDFEKCDASFDSKTPIRRIKQMNTPYSQET
uniref:Reverse transcriptase domain-containing protein n=1 Tax=Tanacetum cinerariifolium TaxID=118510 RepID=A0A6L2NK04_TANCI|nr:hypothetical protein [Tanacetum cinerariifolium]GEW75568.1 hypothetical protein [Tanacetum cinerariifolium]